MDIVPSCDVGGDFPMSAKAIGGPSMCAQGDPENARMRALSTNGYLMHPDALIAPWPLTSDQFPGNHFCNIGATGFLPKKISKTYFHHFLYQFIDGDGRCFNPNHPLVAYMAAHRDECMKMFRQFSSVRQITLVDAPLYREKQKCVYGFVYNSFS